MPAREKKAAAKSAPTRGARPTPYSVHPGVAMVQQWVATLKDKTGKTLEEWVALLRADSRKTIAEKRDWLKRTHKMGANAAWWLVECSESKGVWADGDSDEYLREAARYVEDMYSGGKASLRPLYDALLTLGQSLGSDVRVCPCKTIVPFYRKHVFAQVKPTTRTRIDLGLALAKATEKLPARLIDTGGATKGDRITHRIEIGSAKDIDAEVKKWLRRAYELNAPKA